MPQEESASPGKSANLPPTKKRRFGCHAKTSQAADPIPPSPDPKENEMWLKDDPGDDIGIDYGTTMVPIVNHEQRSFRKSVPPQEQTPGELFMGQLRRAADRLSIRWYRICQSAFTDNAGVTLVDEVATLLTSLVHLMMDWRLEDFITVFHYQRRQSNLLLSTLSDVRELIVRSMDPGERTVTFTEIIGRIEATRQGVLSRAPIVRQVYNFILSWLSSWLSLLTSSGCTAEKIREAATTLREQRHTILHAGSVEYGRDPNLYIERSEMCGDASTARSSDGRGSTCRASNGASGESNDSSQLRRLASWRHVTFSQSTRQRIIRRVCRLSSPRKVIR